MADPGIKRESKFYICATPQNSDLNQGAYEALVFVEIGSIVTLPDMGSTANIVSQDYVNTDVSQKRKGFQNAGESELVIGRDHEDAGQDALRVAAATRYNYAFKLESADAPSSSFTNTIRYSRGVISGPMLTGGGGEDFDNETYQIAFNQLPVIVDPEAI